MSGTPLHPKPFGMVMTKSPPYINELLSQWRAAGTWQQECERWAVVLRVVWNQCEWDADFDATIRREGDNWAENLLKERIGKITKRLSQQTTDEWNAADAAFARSELCDCRRLLLHSQWPTLNKAEITDMRAALGKDYVAAVAEIKEYFGVELIVLKTCYNAALFLADEMLQTAEACTILKESFDEAISNMEHIAEDIYESVTAAMQLQRDALTLWVSDDFEAFESKRKAAGECSRSALRVSDLDNFAWTLFAVANDVIDELPPAIAPPPYSPPESDEVRDVEAVHQTGGCCVVL